MVIWLAKRDQWAKRSLRLVGGESEDTPSVAVGMRSGLGRVRSDFQAAHHEVHERVPIDKKHIAGEGAQVIEERLPRRQSRADETVVLVAKVQEGVVEERQDVHRRQKRGKMFLAVAKVVFEVVTAVFENVVVFVLDLPTGPAGSNQKPDVGCGESRSR